MFFWPLFGALNDFEKALSTLLANETGVWISVAAGIPVLSGLENLQIH